MEFWGVEVLAGKTLKVRPDVGCLIHVSQASIEKGKKGETTLLYVTVDGKKLVIGTLSQGNIPQISFDLVFEKEFELSHSLESGSVHFVGYKSPNMEEEVDDYSDSEEEEEAAAVPAAVPTASGNSTVTTNGSKPADSKPKAKPAEVKPESDEDDDESDEEDDSEEDGSDSEKGMDVDEDDSDEDDSEDEDEDEETPKKSVVSNKKRANESASKSPLSAKKAKPAEEKKGGHTATPHPAKKGGKSPMNANQSPKSGGQSSGGGSNKKQFNSGKQFGSNNKGKGKGKGRA